MEAAALGFAVAAAFKDAYLTAKFIKKTAHSMKNFRNEQSTLVTRFNVQIIRLRHFSRLLRGNADNEVDIHWLATRPKRDLQTVKEVLEELQKVLAEYTSKAATLDNDYKRHSPLSPYFESNTSKLRLRIDDDVPPKEAEDSGDDQSGKSTGDPSETAGKTWFSLGFSLGGDKTRRETTRSFFSVHKLPKGVQWLFTKEKLEETLTKFKEWNDNLSDLVGPLLQGFGFHSDPKLQARLKPDDGINIFEGHIELNNQTRGENRDSFDDKLIPWEEAESKISEPRILVEYKQSGPLDQAQSSNHSSTMRSKVRELYAPRLAGLLRTAGDHSFRTLPFNAYSWDSSQLQFAFLFDYPSGSGNNSPLSLHNLITSEKPDFKLTLEHRFHIAQAVVRSIWAFHSDGWLHKSISSHAVKFFFEKDDEKCNFVNPYLTDFEFSRPMGAVTRLQAYRSDEEHDVYRHPDRYGLPNASFCGVHDVYSLGVVLLEIGLWYTAKQIYDDIFKYELDEKGKLNGVSGERLKETFLADAKARLAHRMGSPYMEAVVCCLEGQLDEYDGSGVFSSEFQQRVVQKVDIRAFLGRNKATESQEQPAT